MSDIRSRSKAAATVLRPSLALLGAFVLGAVLTACSPVAPEDRLELRIEADRVSAAVGDTIQLLGIAHNPTVVTVNAGRGCSPGIGFYATAAGGPELDLYDGLAFICPLLDDQVITPGETDSVSFNWTPTTAGAWTVRSAIVGDGPRSPSSPVAITIR